MREIKRNQAIAIIIVIAVAGALGTWGIITLVTPQPTAYTVPGVSGTVADSQVLKIGVLDDMEYKTGINVWRGAYLAAKEINLAGGVTVAGSKYYIGLISEDTQEADALPDPSKGTTAATKMVSINKPHAIIGGFRTEVLSVYLSTVMAAKIPFIGTGSATPDFTEDVKSDYATNKYFFRVTPMNSTDLGVESAKFLLTRLLVDLAMNGHSVSKVAIIHENLDWVNASVATLNATLVSKGLQTKTYPFSLGSPESTFNTFWDDINNTFGAQLAIPIISGPDGVKL
nr:ABC transporter substrate-binding protein [Candidatus Sigynarchaeota archaeon]